MSDIYDDVRSVTNFADQSTNFSRLSDAVEVLNNKGNFDALLGYMVVNSDSDIITLPKEVEVPLAVNISDQPAFSRGKLYEFTQNGPGSNAELVDWQWLDRGTTPIMGTLDGPTNFQIISDPVDNGKKFIIDLDSMIGDVVVRNRSVITLQSGISGYQKVTKVWSVHKDITIAEVQIVDSNGALVSNYAGNETNPAYRQIKISKTGESVYILFRSTFFRITSMDDELPIRSKMGLIIMIKALQAYRAEDFNLGQALEGQALKLATEEQTQANTFTDVSKATSVASARNLTYNHVDAIIVADIYDDAADIFGPIGEKKLFNKISEARGILSNKAQWDCQRGYVDINVDQYNYVTLPRYVEYPISFNINGWPAEMKNKWYQFHMNGPGKNCMPCDSWQDVGEVVTLRDVPYSIRLTASCDLASDEGKKIIVEGYFKERPVVTYDGDNVIQGSVMTLSTQALPTSQLFDRITRITKEKTNGFVTLLGTDTTTTKTFMVGFFHPDELEPKYRRVKLPNLSCNCSNITVMYKTRAGNISSLTDPIHLKSKTAMILMLRSLKMQETDMNAAELLEKKALQYLTEENLINNQSEVMTVDYGPNFTISNEFINW